MAYETIVFAHAQKSSAPKPATGRHAEKLGECEGAARALLALIQKERDGIFDEMGLDWWLERDTSRLGSSSDPLINMSKRVLQAAEERLAEWREANRR